MILLFFGGLCVGALATWIILRRGLPQTSINALPPRAEHGLADLASGTAHEINNALAPAQLSLELMRDSADVDPELLGLLGRGVERCVRLANVLTRYAEAELAGTDPVAPGALLEALAEALRGALADSRSITVTVDVQPHLPELTGHRDRLFELLRELADNALNAMPGGGQLTLGVRRRVTADKDTFTRFKNLAGTPRDADWIGISITDTGSGLAPEAMVESRRLFVTTGEKRGGTGLGLAIAERIAAAHGGFIDLRSHPGAGTTATVWLPARAQATA
jgi:signal transduction histidine kinase